MDNGTEEAGEKIKEDGKPDWLNNVASPTRFALDDIT